MTEFIIKIDNLIRKFGSVRALDGLSLEIPPGIVFGFLGPNGAGKTTTIRLLLGLLSPTAGTVEVLGKNVAEDADFIRSHTGALLEYHGLYERLTALENLEFYGRIWRIPAFERNNRIRSLLEHFELDERRNDKVGAFSRGMKQKLAVARAMLHNPRLIFLDEPTAGLDPVASARLREDIAGLASNSGMTVFLTTHNLTEADKICNRVAVINKGKLVAAGQTDMLKQQRSRRQVRITLGKPPNSPESIVRIIRKLKSNDDVAEAFFTYNALHIDLNDNANMNAIIELLIHHNLTIEEIIREKATLEDVFLNIMTEEEKKE